MEVYNEFRATVDGAAGFFHEDAFEGALQTTMMESAYAARDKFVGENNQVAFVCDDTPNAARYSAVYAGFKEKNPIIGAVMGGLVHMDDKKLPSLQAADMMANVTKELAVKFVESNKELLRNDPRTNYPGAVKPLRLEDSIYAISIWNWHWMQTLFSANMA